MKFSNSQIMPNLVDTLQIVNQKGLTVLIEAVHEGVAAHVWCEKGNIIHAKVKDIVGEEALFATLQWDDCSITDIPYKNPPHKTISKTFDHLLLDAASSHDESVAHKKERIDTDAPVEIAKNLWWVGHRKPGAPLQINVFLKKFESSRSKKPIWLLIDPGSQIHFPDISRRISEIVDISSIQLFSVNHQDPDVCSSAIYLTELNPKAICITTETTSRLLIHYGIKKFWFVEDKNWALRLVTGHSLIFFPTPFCHFAGAFGIYDPETKVALTGDLFGQTSIRAVGAPLFADKSCWEDLVTFHSIYMPGNNALRYAIDEMKTRCGMPKIIAPQHGGIIRSSMVTEWVDKLYNLHVGLDLMIKDASDDKNAMKYQAATAEILKGLPGLIPGFSVQSLFSENKDLLKYLELSKDDKLIFRDSPVKVLDKLKETLIATVGSDKKSIAAINSSFLRALINRQLPTNFKNQAGADNENVTE